MLILINMSEKYRFMGLQVAKQLGLLFMLVNMGSYL